MSAGRRDLMDRAFHDARVAAFPPGQYVGQESFVRADEIRDIYRRAGVGADTDLLDLCCGIAGPGRLIASETGCRYLGVDASAEAIAVARSRTVGLDCRFRVARVPPLPAGGRDVVLLLETLLAFRDKRALVTGVAEVLRPGGRFACTLEEGGPLTEEEKAAMPASDTVWPVALADFETLLERAGLEVVDRQDRTAAHREIVEALLAEITARRSEIALLAGDRVVDELLTGHRCWSRWLASGRIRKFALLARKR